MSMNYYLIIRTAVAVACHCMYRTCHYYYCQHWIRECNNHRPSGLQHSTMYITISINAGGAVTSQSCKSMGCGIVKCDSCNSR